MHTPLSDLDVKVEGAGTIPLSRLLCDSGSTVLLLSLPTDTTVSSAGAVVGYCSDQLLIDVGSYIQFSTGPSEVCNNGVLVLHACQP